jgi:hypothetical protein
LIVTDRKQDVRPSTRLARVRANNDYSGRNDAEDDEREQPNEFHRAENGAHKMGDSQRLVRAGDDDRMRTVRGGIDRCNR